MASGALCRNHAGLLDTLSPLFYWLPMIAGVLSGVALVAWLYLVFARGGFWLCRERDDAREPLPAVLPHVAVVVPARDEAESIAQSITSLLKQDYPALSIVLVDDNSSDGTAEIARRTASALGKEDGLTIVSGTPLPPRWTGKLWAVKQGIGAAEEAFAPKYLMLTDADIVHASDTASWLVAHAEKRNLVLTCLTARWRCEAFAERVHIPAFIFFFQLLYPFAWVNRTDTDTAAGAGGCMLAHARALRAAGGIDAIRDALIDDCALAAQMKKQGPIWIGLTERVQSVRPYPNWDDIRRMVARSAYTQLGYSPLILTGTILGMMLTYLVPPAMALFASGWPQIFGIAAWALMAVSFLPVLRFYGLSPLWAPALPAITFCFMLYTLDSAYQYFAGKGGTWKGRVQAKAHDHGR
jgi:hopene-associated glycosyltransferase HpnB